MGSCFWTHLLPLNIYYCKHQVKSFHRFSLKTLVCYPEVPISQLMQIGSVLRQAREEAGLSQEELAKAAKLSRIYISFLEHDKRSPTLNVLFKIAAAMKLKASTIVARIERENS